MTIQQKHDALLAFCVRASKDLGASPQSIISLDAEDVQQVLEECGFENEDELRFYVRSLENRGLLVSYVTFSSVGYQITMAGYEIAEGLGVN